MQSKSCFRPCPKGRYLIECIKDGLKNYRNLFVEEEILSRHANMRGITPYQKGLRDFNGDAYFPSWEEYFPPQSK